MIVSCKYELMKLIKSQGFIILLLICIAFDVIAFAGNCLNRDVMENEGNSFIYEDIANLSAENINNHSDSGLMLEIHNTYSDRRISEYYLASEQEYADWDFSGMLLMVISMVTALFLYECELKANMKSVVCIVENSAIKVHIPKVIVLWLVAFAGMLIFLISETVILVVLGKGSPTVNLYSIEKYMLSGFGGSIFSFRLVKMLGAFVVSVMLSVLTLLFMRIYENSGISLGLSAGIWGAMLISHIILPDKIKQFIPIEISMGDYIYEGFPVLFISKNYYLHSAEVAWISAITILLIIALLLTNMLRKDR